VSGVGGLIRTIGLRHLLERRLRTFLAAGGIAAGVALVFSISSMNAALNQTISDTVGAFSGPADLQVTAVATGTITPEVVDRVRAADGVAAAAPLLQMRSRLAAGGREVDAFVLGVTPDLLSFAPERAKPLPLDAASADAEGVAVGARLAEELHVRAGDRVTVLTPSGPASLRVAGILPRGPTDRINAGRAIAISLPFAQRLFDRPDQIDLVLVAKDRGVGSAAVADAVGDAAGTTGVVTTPDDAPGGRSENVQPFLMISEVVGLLSLFVAFVLVFNTMSMAMAERRGELALATALGARRRQLFVACLGEAALVGIVGTGLGLGAGALLADRLLAAAGGAYRSVLPVDPPSGAVLVGPHLAIAAVGGVLVAILGAMLPARRVLRTAPIAALRPANDYEWAPDERRRILPVVLGGGLLAVSLVLGLGLRTAAPSMTRAAVIVIAIMAGITLLLPAALPLVTDRFARVLERGCGVVGRLAGDSLRANPRRTSITLATLILPLGAVIGMGTAFSSAQAMFHRLAVTYNGFPIVVSSDSSSGYTATQPIHADQAPLFAAVPGVRSALPFQNMFLTTEGGPAIVYGTPAAAASREGVLSDVRNVENADDPHEFVRGLLRGDVAVSRLMARNRHLEVGDTMTLPTIGGPVRVRVASLFDDLAGLDSMYVEYEDFVRYWADDGVLAFGISLEPGADRAAVMRRLEAVVREHDLPGKVVPQEQAVADLERQMSGLFSIARTMQLAAVAVAGLSLASTAFTTVLERRWTLGLQRALGLSRSQIARSLALEAALIASVGALGASVVGISIGVVMSQAFGLVAGSSLPITIPWTVIGACVLGALVLSLLATAYPRRLATRTEIIDALVTE
jgi:putative ABC transport system permease protein